MEFLMAFIVGGLLCACFETISQVTKVSPPVILMFGIVFGGLFNALGIAGALTGVAGAGYSIMVVGFGSAVYAAAAQAIAGSWLAAGVLIAVVAILVVIGIACGSGHRAVMRTRDAGEADGPLSAR